VEKRDVIRRSTNEAARGGPIFEREKKKKCGPIHLKGKRDKKAFSLKKLFGEKEGGREKKNTVPQ